ncbi:glucosaminidase domain-containing protein [uncultured Phascolarctobacterium sp.]|uniref:glucosaminidase domain-containing protein n=1 Tax=uncultured Phascolarctobacterium sp. TaxID=512296 RepID=UPI00261C6162|nr:glucosaminidase domain-containing protein [uncultured Phascolarctobacterium sp.]
MKYKKLIALFAAASMLLAADFAEAKHKNVKPPAKSNTKITNKTLKNGKQSTIIKPGPKGGISIVTTKDSAVSREKKNFKQNPLKTVKINKDSVTAKNVKPMLVEQDGKSYFLGTELPQDYKNISIYGEAAAYKEQAVALIKQNNPNVRLACSVEELVDLYWQEAEREGVRPDLALCQSLVETGTYAYGGDVHHNQNNFCGLGTTGGGVKGAVFKTPEIGVRAHIQHLLAYTQNKRPKTAIVDPRYELAHKIRMERGVVNTWYGLNGTWAMGALYCEKIMATYQKMLAMQVKIPKEKQEAKNKKKQDKQDKKSHRMRERIQEMLKEK